MLHIPTSLPLRKTESLKRLTSGCEVRVVAASERCRERLPVPTYAAMRKAKEESEGRPYSRR